MKMHAGVTVTFRQGCSPASTPSSSTRTRLSRAIPCPRKKQHNAQTSSLVIPRTRHTKTSISPPVVGGRGPRRMRRPGSLRPPDAHEVALRGETTLRLPQAARFRPQRPHGLMEVRASSRNNTLGKVNHITMRVDVQLQLWNSKGLTLWRNGLRVMCLPGMTPVAVTARTP